MLPAKRNKVDISVRLDLAPFYRPGRSRGLWPS